MPWSHFLWFQRAVLDFFLSCFQSSRRSNLHPYAPSTFPFLCYWLSLMLVSTGERQEWMETLQTATRLPPCGSQKRSDSLSHLSSTNKRGLLELRSYKGRVLVSLTGSKVRLCKTEQVLSAPPGHPLYRMTASCLKWEDNNRSLFEADETERFIKEKGMFMHVQWRK